jgi:hypothetical protein
MNKAPEEYVAPRPYFDESQGGWVFPYPLGEPVQTVIEVDNGNRPDLPPREVVDQWLAAGGKALVILPGRSALP